MIDEATANIDVKNDTLIQKVIAEKFKDSTVITIAHRLNTIADYDKVIVMKRGKIVEHGSPWMLLQKKGQFADMVSHTGKNAELIRAKALEHYQQKMSLNFYSTVRYSNKVQRQKMSSKKKCLKLHYNSIFGSRSF